MENFFQVREAPPGHHPHLFVPLEQRNGATVVGNYLAQLLQGKVKKIRQIEGGAEDTRHLGECVGHLSPFPFGFEEPGVLDGHGGLDGQQLEGVPLPLVEAVGLDKSHHEYPHRNLFPFDGKAGPGSYAPLPRWLIVRKQGMTEDVVDDDRRALPDDLHGQTFGPGRGGRG